MSHSTRRKSRVDNILSESLAEKIEGYDNKETSDSIYSPVKSTKIDFMHTVEEALGQEEVSEQKTKRGVIKGLLVFLIVLLALGSLMGLGVLAYYVINSGL